MCVNAEEWICVTHPLYDSSKMNATGAVCLVMRNFQNMKTGKKSDNEIGACTDDHCSVFCFTRVFGQFSVAALDKEYLKMSRKYFSSIISTDCYSRRRIRYCCLRRRC